MKFTELPYSRPDVGAVCEKISLLTEKLKEATSAAEQLEIIKEKEAAFSAFSTMATIASIRHTVDTRDAFYEAENDFFDENGPVIEEKAQEVVQEVEQVIEETAEVFEEQVEKIPETLEVIEKQETEEITEDDILR
jgi:oligoendopeptidase F